MKNENLKYCLYYKGEDECPYSWDDPLSGFWKMEERYYVFKFNSEHEKWEELAASAEILDAFPILSPLLKGRMSKEQKGFIAFTAVDIDSLSPMGLEKVLQTFAKEYGRKN